MQKETDITHIQLAIKKYWGYDELRPLQAQAIQAELDQHDSLVVMPTGGGKSLCYQVPPLLSDRVDFVISPLISLMKDQVDGLRSNGYPAAAIHSALRADERREAENYIASGQCKLVFISPERLSTSWFDHISNRLNIGAFAIDEAHCISHWGHDFRPEYRKLSYLKQRHAGASLHAYTATATERVQQDIILQLGLNDPQVLVGIFDRPNLVYRVQPRDQLRNQVKGVIDRHEGEAVIIYAISRAETERLSKFLKEKGVRAGFYHAGMNADERRRTQEAFTREDLDVIVATVAFGMGIDRSNVRCVIHAGMPQSIEHYQQETGRAGRDGLEAECILFYSPADVIKWQSLIERSKNGNGQETDSFRTAMYLLGEMRKFCAPGRCRHKLLSEYFGQAYDTVPCQNCDVCLGEVDDLVDGTVQAQKILSCVIRLRGRFGAGYLADVLKGSENARIRSRGHDQLSTYGIMTEYTKKEVMYFIFQLVDQELLTRVEGDYPVLTRNSSSDEVLYHGRKVWLMPAKSKKVKQTKVALESWDGVDRGLFDALKMLRTQYAKERGVPPYVVFGDITLRQMAKNKPQTKDSFLSIHGVGEKKLEDYGEAFIEAIQRYAEGRSEPL